MITSLSNPHGYNEGYWRKMKILAIDPALRHTGCVLFEDGIPTEIQVLTTKPNNNRWATVAEKDQEAVSDFSNTLRSVIRETAPDLICSEQSLGGAQSASAVKALALINGAIYAMSTEDAMPPWIFTRVHDAKKLITGKKSATKLEMIEGAVKRFPTIKPYIESKRSADGWTDNAEHIADACASYVVCINTPAVKMLIAQAEKK